MKNIHYQTEELSNYYSQQRICWDEFYPSERWIFEKVAGRELNIGRVLDVGCACGGLAGALEERFSVEEYVGVDINAQAIEKAKSEVKDKSVRNKRFECGDILEINSLEAEGFDTVFSLSCADWNISTREIISACWRYVREGGAFVLTLRLTQEVSLLHMHESYQYICFDENLPENVGDLEKAPYVVLNVREALFILGNLKPKPKKITAFGYWGTPSKSAKTPYNRLVFTAIAIEKGEAKNNKTTIECHWPLDLLL